MTRAAQRPQPRPGVLDIKAYVPGKSSAPGVDKVFKLSSNETPLGASPKAIEAYAAHRPSTCRIIRTAPRPRCARRSARRSASIRPASSAARAPTNLLNLIAHAYLQDGDEAIHTTHGFLVYPIVTLGAGGTPVVAAEKDFTADVDAILARGDAEDQDRVPGQPEQSDRHLHPVRRGEAPARRAAEERAAGARRRLRRIRAAQRLRVRHRTGRDVARTS